jgi:hypothetical protein
LWLDERATTSNGGWIVRGGICWTSCAGAVALILCTAVAVPRAALAQDGGKGSLDTTHQGTLIGGQSPPPATFERCVEVEVGGERSFGCLNQKLKREVDRANPSLNLPPLDARSPDIRVGNVNEAAVRQQYGSNYGKSVVPFRPPVPTYAIPRR